MEELIRTIVEDPTAGYDHQTYLTVYCLTKQRYASHAAKVKLENGEMTSSFLECDKLAFYSPADEERYWRYKSALETYLAETKDNVEFHEFAPKSIVVRTLKVEHAETARLAAVQRAAHARLIADKIRAFQDELAELGVTDYEDEYYSERKIQFPESCRDRDDWYDVREEINYPTAQFQLVFHRETALYRRLDELQLGKALKKRHGAWLNDREKGKKLHAECLASYQKQTGKLV